MFRFTFICTVVAATLASIVAAGKVTFHCEDHGWLYIRGKHVADVHNKVPTVWTGPLYEGDIVTITAKNDKSAQKPDPVGCNAKIEYSPATGEDKLEIMYTSGANWRSIALPKTRTPRDLVVFTKTNLDHCRAAWWKKPRPALASTLVDPKAKRIWAWGTPERVALRTMVGAPHAGCRYSVHASAARRQWLYVNGRLMLDTEDWRTVKSVWGHLRYGDVVAVKAMGGTGKGGFGALIKTYVGRFDTTYRHMWVASKADPELVKDKSIAWTKKEFTGACNWEQAVIGTATPQDGIHSTLHGEDIGYIWAKNAGPNDAVLFRTVIGIGGPGQQCKGGQW